MSSADLAREVDTMWEDKSIARQDILDKCAELVEAHAEDGEIAWRFARYVSSVSSLFSLLVDMCAL